MKICDFHRRARSILVLATRLAVLLLVSSLLPAPVLGASPPQETADQSTIQAAASWIASEDKIETEYHYVMTCKLRLLLFWAGRDDVGGGYVRIGKVSGNEQQRIIRLLFGSDPAKTPLSINRWGAATEVSRTAGPGEPEASAFFGFMKSSKGQSVLAMQRELSKEKANGSHLFEGIISVVDADRALSTTVPYTSNQDFDLYQYADAEKAALQQLENNPARQIRRLEGKDRSACPRTGEFLTTTLQLMDDALADRATPDSLCYIYNARHYQATLVSVHSVAEKKVHVVSRGNEGTLDQTYHHLKQAHFEVKGIETGTISLFDILLGTEGDLRGAPIQITYAPNWWFQVVLNLAPASPSANSPGTVSR
jgi:hypothetical protein